MKYLDSQHFERYLQNNTLRHHLVWGSYTSASWPSDLLHIVLEHNHSILTDWTNRRLREESYFFE